MKLQYYLFLLAQKAVARLPVSFTRTIARAGALVYFYLFPRKRRLVERNMRRALGSEASDLEVSRTARRACRYYADYWVDILWLPTMSREYVLERFGKVNLPALTSAIFPSCRRETTIARQPACATMLPIWTGVKSVRIGTTTAPIEAIAKYATAQFGAFSDSRATRSPDATPFAASSPASVRASGRRLP